ncbi:MAG: rod shape-determining protein MreC [Elusimicrobiota bacterium]
MDEEKRWVVGVFFFLFLVNIFFLTFNFTGKIQSLKKIFFYVFSPVINVTEDTVSAAEGISSKAHRLLSAYQENTILREEMKKALHWKNEYDRLIEENKRFHQLLQLKERLPYFTVAVRIIARDPHGWYQTVIIDKGSRDKILMNQPVIAVQNGKEGVVGRISEVSSSSAKVLLLTDSLSGAAADVQRSGINGVLLGRNEDQLSFNFVTNDADIQKDDLLVTSGIGEVFPPGLALGKIEKIVVNKYQIFQTISVRPTLDFHRLHELLVLIINNKE